MQGKILLWRGTRFFSPLHNKQKNEGKGALGEFVHAHAYKRESCETRANQTVSSIY